MTRHERLCGWCNLCGAVFVLAGWTWNGLEMYWKAHTLWPCVPSLIGIGFGLAAWRLRDRRTRSGERSAP